MAWTSNAPVVGALLHHCAACRFTIVLVRCGTIAHRVAVQDFGLVATPICRSACREVTRGRVVSPVRASNPLDGYLPSDNISQRDISNHDGTEAAHWSLGSESTVEARFAPSTGARRGSPDWAATLRAPFASPNTVVGSIPTRRMHLGRLGPRPLTVVELLSYHQRGGTARAAALSGTDHCVRSLAAWPFEDRERTEWAPEVP